MKKFNFCLLLLLMAVMLFPAPSGQEQDQGKAQKKKTKPRKFDIEIAYAYREEGRVINETDLNCTHFFRDDQSQDMVITGSQQMEWNKTDYTDGEKMFINKGSNDGLSEDSVLMILGKGDNIRNPFTGKKLGTYYLKKSLATIDCLYEDKAVIQLNKGCHPVQIGDIAIPYEEKEVVMEKKLNYKMCRLPQSEHNGQVVYTNIYTNAERDLVSEGQYLTIDQGISTFEFADWVLFYKIIKEELPPVIIGSGIVIDVQNTSSTVKVIESAFPVEVGAYVTKLDRPDKDDSLSTETIHTATNGEENIPLQGMKNPDDPEAGKALELNVYFDINHTDLQEQYKPELDKIKAFIQDKNQFVVILRGYSCSIGGFEHNLKLSQQRVDSVKKYLIDTLGIQEKFIDPHHYGEKDAPFDNSSEAQRRKNRLVNVEVRGL